MKRSPHGVGEHSQRGATGTPVAARLTDMRRGDVEHARARVAEFRASAGTVDRAIEGEGSPAWWSGILAHHVEMLLFAIDATCGTGTTSPTEGTYSALLARLDGLSERDHNRLLGRLVVMAPAVLNEAIDRVVGS